MYEVEILKKFFLLFICSFRSALIVAVYSIVDATVVGHYHLTLASFQEYSDHLYEDKKILKHFAWCLRIFPLLCCLR